MHTELRFETKQMLAASLGEEACVPDLAGESILQNQLTFRLDECEELYDGYGRVKNAYPYRQRNTYSRKLEEKTVKTAVLENDYLKAVFLTEYGGRLWELWDKESGENLLYTNDVLQFSNLAVKNAWFSGGVEWNIGIIGHSPFTTEQIYVARTEDEKGNPVLRMYEYERIRDVTYQMDFWLEEDSHFLNCRMRVANENADVVPMYWWSNIAVPEFEGGRIIVPADSAYTNAKSEVFKVDIPMVNGIDVTDYKKIPKAVDYFFEIKEGQPKYIANVDKDGFGLMQRSTSRLRSRKLFSWGNGTSSDNWQAFLTKDAGRYIEIQAGLGKTQYGCIPMAPNTVWEWLEQYGPIRVESTDLALTHEERSAKLTKRLQEERISGILEDKLKASKEIALKEAELVTPGSGYGIMGTHGKWTSHLEFTDVEGDYSKWKAFIDGDRFPCPNPEKRPDVFMDDAVGMERLREAVKGEAVENWYAHYQLGVRYYRVERYKKAEKEFRESLELEKNAWALHGLACIELLQNKKKKAVRHIMKGMKLQKAELSYIKEGFKMLISCEAYEELLRFYYKLSEEMQEESRIKFYYLEALGRTGEAEKAYELMGREDGSMVLDDLREGEATLSDLWTELHENLYGEKGELPQQYQFMGFE